MVWCNFVAHQSKFGCIIKCTPNFNTFEWSHLYLSDLSIIFFFNFFFFFLLSCLPSIMAIVYKNILHWLFHNPFLVCTLYHKRAVHASMAFGKCQTFGSLKYKILDS